MEDLSKPRLIQRESFAVWHTSWHNQMVTPQGGKGCPIAWVKSKPSTRVGFTPKVSPSQSRGLPWSSSGSLRWPEVPWRPEGPSHVPCAPWPVPGPEVI